MIHLAIAGNIGAGKTTLTQLIANHYQWQPQFEYVVDNPYLNDFYEDMQRWAFHQQIYYLNVRFSQIQQIRQNSLNIVQDRTIYEDAYIFAPNLHEMGVMSTRDFDTYSALFQNMETFLSPPDLLIYLKASVPTLIEHIQKRGRMYEKNIREDYLARLNQRYQEWMKTYKRGKLIVVDIDTNYFADKKGDLQTIIHQIDQAIDHK